MNGSIIQQILWQDGKPAADGRARATHEPCNLPVADAQFVQIKNNPVSPPQGRHAMFQCSRQFRIFGTDGFYDFAQQVLR